MGWGAWWSEHGELLLGVVVGGVISAIVSWIYYRKTEKPKRLAYEIRTNSRIISAGRDERKDLQVIYNGATVKNPNLTIVRVGNIGKQDIVAEDFRNSPIKLHFDGSLVLSATPSDQQNPSISGQFSEIPGSNVVGVIPDHLKSNEWFDLRIVTDGDLVEPKIEARIMGETHPIMAADLVLRHRGRIRAGGTVKMNWARKWERWPEGWSLPEAADQKPSNHTKLMAAKSWLAIGTSRLDTRP